MIARCEMAIRLVVLLALVTLSQYGVFAAITIEDVQTAQKAYHSPQMGTGYRAGVTLCWPVDRACSRLGSPFSRLVMFSRLLPGCLTPTSQQRRHNYICQATCPGCPLFPGCPAAQCSLFSRLLLSRLFTRHYPLGSDSTCFDVDLICFSHDILFII